MVEIDASGPGLVRLITRLDGNVTPHYHLVGDENYYILEGEGQLEYSLVVDEESAFLEVRAGDSFLIPVGRGPFSARKADICF